MTNHCPHLEFLRVNLKVTYYHGTGCVYKYNFVSYMYLLLIFHTNLEY